MRSGYERAIIRELAKHAVTEAAETILRIANSAPPGLEAEVVETTLKIWDKAADIYREKINGAETRI